VNSFVGREQECKEVRRLLAQTRLLSLTGSGGTGKTRLSVEAASDILHEYPDGIWFVEFASVTDPELLVQTIAETLHLREMPGVPVLDTLTSSLRDKKTLFVLDNCEHVLESAALVVDSILRSCPQVKLLVTSREALGIAGERAFRIPSFAIPDPKIQYSIDALLEFACVKLFLDRATEADSSFDLLSQDTGSLASICARLDGIPLAIELAAARVKSMQIPQIESRLDSRFRLLTGGSRTALPRQQTLRALIDWSFSLLSEREKVLFQRLSVFQGGWRLEAAQSVCSGEDIDEWDVLDLLASLVAKNLVVYEDSLARPRYRFLETIAQYSRERLIETQESAVVYDSHRNYFLSLAQEAESGMRGLAQLEWLSRLDDDLENMRVALTWSLAGEGSATSLMFCQCLSYFWICHGHQSEGHEWCARSLEKNAPFPKTSLRGRVLNLTRYLHRDEHEWRFAKQIYEESLSIFEQVKDRRGVLESTLWLRIFENGGNDLKSLFEEDIDLARQAKDWQRIASVTNLLGCITRDRLDDIETAIIYFKQSLQLFREIGNRFGCAEPLTNLGNLAALKGDFAEALAYQHEDVEICMEMGDRLKSIFGLEMLALTATCQAKLSVAATLWAAATAAREQHASPRVMSYYHFNEPLESSDFYKEAAQGRAMTIEEAVQFALEHCPVDTT
jgi:predicted ATPase